MHRKHLLTSVQMARFVAYGSHRIDGVVPADMNAEAIEVLRAGIPAVPYGTPLSETFADGGPTKDPKQAALNVPTGVALDSGNLYIAEQRNCIVRKVTGTAIDVVFAGERNDIIVSVASAGGAGSSWPQGGPRVLDAACNHMS